MIQVTWSLKILEKKVTFLRNKTISQSDQFPLWKHKFMAKAKKFLRSFQKENPFLGRKIPIKFLAFLNYLQNTITWEAFLLLLKLL